jgi:hypothetical protein
VPGVKAALGHADRFERVFLRPQTHLLAVVPRDYARTAALLLKRAAIKAPRPGEAMRLKLLKPHDAIGLKGTVELPASISELRLWIVPRADGGADVFGEGDTPDAPAAASAVRDLQKILRSVNTLGIEIVTHGLLNNLEFTADGSTVRLHLPASRDQLEIILSLVAGAMGVNIPLPPPPAPPGVP